MIEKYENLLKDNSEDLSKIIILSCDDSYNFKKASFDTDKRCDSISYLSDYISCIYWLIIFEHSDHDKHYLITNTSVFPKVVELY